MPGKRLPFPPPPALNGSDGVFARQVLLWLGAAAMVILLIWLQIPAVGHAGMMLWVWSAFFTQSCKVSMSTAFISAQNVFQDATLPLIFSLKLVGKLSHTPISELLIISILAYFARSRAFSMKTTWLHMSCPPYDIVVARVFLSNLSIDSSLSRSAGNS